MFEAGSGATRRARSYTVVLTRGPRYATATPRNARSAADSPLWDGLVALGFDAAAANRLLKEYPRPAVREWLDITTAARERFGRGFFTRSPQAYLVDNLKQAATSGRTPPEWWHELRSRERQRTRTPAAPIPGESRSTAPPGPSLPDQTAAVLRQIADAAFAPVTAPPPPAPVPTVADILRPRR